MRPRPLVDYVVPLQRDEVLERFRARLDAKGSLCTGHVGDKEVSLVLHDDARRPWSPYISLDVRPTDEGTHVHGRFGPHPNLWGAFVAIYAAQLFLFIGASVYGLAQLAIGEPPTGLYVAPFPLLGLGCSCGVDLTGRSRGALQMDVIREYVDRVIPEAIDRGSP